MLIEIRGFVCYVLASETLTEMTVVGIASTSSSRKERRKMRNEDRYRCILLKSFHCRYAFSAVPFPVS